MQIIQDMLRYWSHPTFDTRRQKIDGRRLKALGKLLAFCFAVIFLFSGVLGGVFAALGVTPPDASAEFQEMMQNTAFFITTAVILAPLIEEVLFRSWMGATWGILLVLPLLLWGAALSVFLMDKALPPSVDLFIIIALSLLISAYLIQYCRTASWTGHHERAVKRLFPFIFWMIAIGFGALHIGNYDMANMGVVGSLIILPQLFVGAVLGFLRMRFGLICAIGFHSAYNGILVGFSLLVFQFA